MSLLSTHALDESEYDGSVEVRISASSPEATEVAAFVDELRRGASRLHLDLRLHTQAAWYAQPGAGTAAVVFLDSARPIQAADDEAIAAFVADGGTIFLIAERDTEVWPAIAEVPAAQSVNAFLWERYGTAWPAAAVDELLTLLMAHRSQRKVFISYRRTDARAISEQLFDHLTRLGLSVFRDEYSVERGRNFQAELWFWLNDADLVLLLASPRLGESRWVLEEVNFAHVNKLGMLAVEWPGTADPSKTLPARLFADERLQLGLDDFSGDWARPEQMLLSEAGLDKVVAHALAARAGAMNRRLHELIRMIHHHLQPRFEVHHERLGDLRCRGEDGDCFVRVFPFRPDPLALFGAAEDAGEVPSVVAVYAENAPKDPRAHSIDWLARSSRPHPHVAGTQMAFDLIRIPEDLS